MRLPVRARSERLRVDPREQPFGLVAQVAGDRVARLRPREGRDPVEDQHQLVAVLLRNEVRAQRQELPDLDIGRSEALEQRAQPAWLNRSRRMQ